MTPPIFIDQCNLGLGLFASRNIKRGETIFVFSGRVISDEEGKISPNPIQIGTHLYIDPEQGWGRFINHSCQPNVGIVKNNIVIALQNISFRTEIRFDYSTTMLERHWTMECFCGAPQCRKIIKDFDLLPLKLQQYYLKLGIVQDFIVEHVKSIPLQI